MEGTCWFIQRKSEYVTAHAEENNLSEGEEHLRSREMGWVATI
jgi:hypothetical protein